MSGTKRPSRHARLMRLRFALVAMMPAIGLGVSAAVVSAWRIAVILLVLTLIALAVAVDQLRAIAIEDGGILP